MIEKFETMQMPMPQIAKSAGTAYGSHGEPEQRPDWSRYYRDYRTQVNIHQFLSDCLSGGGGFRGDVPLNNDGINSDPRWSYLTPDSTEPQYLSRVKNTEYYNIYGRYIAAKSAPIFSEPIETLVSLNGVKMETDSFFDFVNDCTGTGLTYQSFEANAIREAHCHGAVYVVIDRIKNGELPTLYTYSALDCYEDSIITDRSGRLIKISFFDRTETIKNTSVPVRRTFTSGFVSEEYLEGDDWKTLTPSIATGVPVLNVFPFFVDDREPDQYYPKLPESYSIARCTTDLYNKLSWTMWNLKLHGFPIFYAYNVKGLSRSLGHIISLSVGADGVAIPPPAFASPDASGLDMCFRALEYLEKQARNVMREHGVMVEEAATSQAQSGESKSYDFWATNETLKISIQDLKRLFTWVSKMFNMFESRGGQWEYSRRYRDEFAPRTERSILELTDGYNLAERIGAMETAGEIMKMIAYKLIGNSVSTDRMSELAIEIIDSAKNYSAGDRIPAVAVEIENAE